MRTRTPVRSINRELIVAELARRKVFYFCAFAFLTAYVLHTSGAIGPRALWSVQIAVGAVLTGLLARVTRRALRRTFFFVRNKLIASYVLIGLVPVLLAVPVFGIIGFLTLGQIYAYQAARGMNNLLDTTETIRARIDFRIQRLAPAESASALRGLVQEVLVEEAEPLREKLPGIVLSVGITDPDARDTVQAYFSFTEYTPARLEPPNWVQTNPFGGFVVRNDGVLTLKSFSTSAAGRFDVTIDVSLPVVRTTLNAVREGLGAELRTLIPGPGQSPGGWTELPYEAGESTTDEPSRLTRRGGRAFWEGIPIWGIWVINAQRWSDASTGEVARFLIAETDLGNVVDILGSMSIENNTLVLSFLVGAAILFLAIELLSLGAGIAFARSITSSLGELTRGTEQIRRGNFAHEIRVGSRDQLGELAGSFNEMVRSIDGFLKESIEKERMSEELRIGHRVQQSLLPSNLDGFPGLLISASNHPAREVGGDYYDVFALGGQTTGVVIADVAGKGISAAFFMAELKGLALSLSRTTSSPRQFLIEANRILHANLERKMFVTMTYALFDIGRSCARIARAGHCPVLLARRDADGAELVVPHGIGLALDSGALFESLLEEQELPAGPGDTFVFYTDGVSEAMDPADRIFGEERLVNLLSEWKGESAARIRQVILGEVARFTGGGGMLDDRSLIVVKIADTSA